MQSEPTIVPVSVPQRRGDDTLFALIDGVVKFEPKDKRRLKVSVYPLEAMAS